ncbi:hypothetical protein [Blastococcus sp. PRF04-17]|uniref:hypothetical protein n=1 Tax=Blastococcus sp. PRF04-17 TaxID=2933797 RepID=UPI001FF51636|nr:hypothetical protein [Blastococcus sp. PRF04-17]UOY03221.1 hypothetical protein MVA48_07715 [Blastococcus sp. PRF04-17]
MLGSWRVTNQPRPVQVGGDRYDDCRQPDDDTTLVIGDVVGTAPPQKQQPRGSDL